MNPFQYPPGPPINPANTSQEDPWKMYSQLPIAAQVMQTPVDQNVQQAVVQNPLNFNTQVQQVAPGSGLKNESDLNRNTTSKGTTTTVARMTPEEMVNMEESIRNLPSIQQQERSQKLNEDLFRQQLTKTPNVDIATALANLSDYNQTGKLGNRQPAESQKDYQARILNWAKSLQDDQRDISNSIAKYAQATKAGMTTQQYIDAITNSMKSSAQDPNLTPNNAPQVNFSKWYSQTQKDMSKDIAASHEIGNLITLINGNPVQQAEIAITITKILTGGSRQPVMEVAMAKDPSFAVKWGNMISRLETGQIDPRLQSQYLQFAKELAANVTEGLSIKKQQALAAAEGYGVDRSKAENVLKDAYLNPYSHLQNQQKPQFSFSDLLNELKKSKQEK